jgi:hypothetical protein
MYCLPLKDIEASYNLPQKQLVLRSTTNAIHACTGHIWQVYTQTNGMHVNQTPANKAINLWTMAVWGSIIGMSLNLNFHRSKAQKTLQPKQWQTITICFQPFTDGSTQGPTTLPDSQPMLILYYPNMLGINMYWIKSSINWNMTSKLIWMVTKV